MATLKRWLYWELDLPSIKHFGGSRSSPTEVTVDGYVIEHKFSLAATTTKSIWNGTSDELTNFEYLYIESDQDVRIELTVDVGNEVGDELWAKIIKANQPFDIMEDDALAVYTANFATGTADVIDRLRIRNAGSTAANVRIVMVT